MFVKRSKRGYLLVFREAKRRPNVPPLRISNKNNKFDTFLNYSTEQIRMTSTQLKAKPIK